MSAAFPQRTIHSQIARRLAALACAIAANPTAMADGVLCLRGDLLGQAPAPALGITIVGDRGYLAGGSSGGLSIFDISDPTTPVQLGEYVSPNVAQNVDVENHIAYLADGSHLRVLDVADPTTPTLLTSYPTTSALRNVKVVGDLAYLCQFKSLAILSIGAPGSPQPLGSLATMGDNIWDVEVLGTIAYLADGAGALHIADVSNPSAPALLGSVAVEGVAYAVKVVDHVAHVVSTTGVLSGGRLHLIDVSVPSSPRPLSTLWLPAGGRGIDVVNGIAYVACELGGLQIVDVSQPAAPTLGANYSFLLGIANGVQVSGSLAYLAAGAIGGLMVVDVSTAASPVVAALALGGPAAQMAEGGGHAYVRTVGGSMLHVIDTADPRRPHVAGTFRAAGPIVDLAAAGSLVVLSDESVGLLLIDASDPTRPREIGALPFEHVVAAAIEGALVAVVDRSPDLASSLYLVDVTDPSSPLLVNVMEHAFTDGKDVSLANGFAYVADEDGFHVVDVAEPSRPAVIGYAATGSASLIIVEGDRAYVRASTCGNFFCFTSNKIVDVANPAKPVEVGFAGSGSLAVDGAWILESNGIYRFTVLDATDSAGPVPVARYSGPHGNALALRDPLFWIATPTGLEIIDIGDCRSAALVGDLDGNGVVDGADLAILLGSWGRCPGCPGDLDGDGVVDATDLTLLLAAWS